MSDYLTIIYRITHPGQPKALLEQAEWSAASHSHAIRERDLLLEFAEEVRRSGDARLASMAIAVICRTTGSRT